MRVKLGRKFGVRLILGIELLRFGRRTQASLGFFLFSGGALLSLQLLLFSAFDFFLPLLERGSLSSCHGNSFPGLMGMKANSVNPLLERKARESTC